MTKRHFLIAAVLLLSISSAFAQGNGLSGINQATNMVTSYFDPATKLIYAIGAVVGLIGGGKSVLKIFVRRPGHLEDSRKLVWGVYFLDSRSHHFKKFLPLSLWRPILLTRESVAR